MELEVYDRAVEVLVGLAIVRVDSGSEIFLGRDTVP